MVGSHFERPWGSKLLNYGTLAGRLEDEAREGVKWYDAALLVMVQTLIHSFRH